MDYIIKTLYKDGPRAEKKVKNGRGPNTKLCSNGALLCTHVLPFISQAINKYSTYPL